MYLGFLLAYTEAIQRLAILELHVFFLHLHRSQLISAPLDQTMPKKVLLNIMPQTALHAKESLAMEYMNLLKANY